MATATPEPPSSRSLRWAYCGHGATSADSVGCRGIRVGDHTSCLAHLNEAHRAAYLATLSPGADIDHRGTPFTLELLDQLLAALDDPATGAPHIGAAWFDEATFSDIARFGGATFSGVARFGGVAFPPEARFEKATFTGDAWFDEATFTGRAGFAGATFSGVARFDKATFSHFVDFQKATFASGTWFTRATFATGGTWFTRATFTGDTRFDEATFPRETWFEWVTFTGDTRFNRANFAHETWFTRATFTGDARFDGANFAHETWFSRVTFSGDVRFDYAQFSDTIDFEGTTFTGNAQFYWTTLTGDARFGGTQFKDSPRLGPLVCAKQVVLDRAVFQQPVTVEIVARQVSCARTRWAATATLYLRYAELNLRDAVIEYPVLVAARSSPFPTCNPGTLIRSRHGREVPMDDLMEEPLSGAEPGVRLVSMDGVDAAHLVLHDVDLSRCRFAGAVHLDQLRVDGWCTFATTPTGWSRRFPWRWSRRNTVTEEHHWRVRTGRHPDRATARGWTSPLQDAPELKPAAVAALYRQLRKSLEDGKNEPDAADFYYGECEMRRHDPGRPWGERALLALYWAFSGYGLRATRALAWLGAAMAVTIAVMMVWGLPADDPKPTTTGLQVPVGQTVELTTDTPDPVNPTGPLTERVTTERLEKGLRVVINSVIFRSSGQDLTTTGTYTEMTSRLAEPVLLGLAVLAVRGRVKR
ncbi:pentapeptide repeat-containing protein [Streptomyces sp. NPDC096046]|uniref:pentapeptide repeat-containing protein n=1 Tax=Streptomyces sp. NPDC096046 TaxID=3155542 RepID=UPI003325E90C